MTRSTTCLVLSVLLAGPAAAGPTFEAQLSPDDEVPPVVSSAEGMATLEFSDTLDSVDYRLVMTNITSPLLQAHIHLAAPGLNGPIASFLFTLCALPGCGPSDLLVSGDQVTLAGTATTTDLLGGVDFADIVDAIQNGEAYINIHTTAFPGGELRGNLNEPCGMGPELAVLLPGLMAWHHRRRRGIA